MHGQKPFTPKLAEGHLGLFFNLELGPDGDGLAESIGSFFPSHVASESENQSLVLTMLLTVWSHFVDVKMPTPSFPGFARNFEPTVLAALTPRPCGITMSFKIYFRIAHRSTSRRRRLSVGTEGKP